MKRIAVIRIGGMVRKRKELEDTLNMLRLKRKFSCVVVDDTKQNKGMIEKVKDLVTYGEIDDETLKMLIEKRAKINPKDKRRTKAFFRLSPPRGGFERKGTKVQFELGGALGYRGEKINDLIKRML